MPTVTVRLARGRSILFFFVLTLLVSACGAPTATTNPDPTPANPPVAPTPAGAAYRRQGPGVIVLSLG
ncbi:MAG: hypothetical protein OEW09_07990, partial [Anaerolineae bacterium]|nr:hypothetical protein [Anaerolineae bacterium]